MLPSGCAELNSASTAVPEPVCSAPQHKTNEVSLLEFIFIDIAYRLSQQKLLFKS